MSSVGKIFNLNEAITPELAARIYTSADRRDAEFMAKVFLVFNFFEAMAIAVKNRHLNEDIVRDFYAGMLVRFYDNASVFLPIIRNSPTVIANHPFGATTRPDIFVNADWLYQRWRDYYRAYFPPAPGEHRATWIGSSVS